MEGYIPIQGFFTGLSLCIIFITGRNSEAALGEGGGAQNLVFYVLKRQKRQVRAVNGCDRAAKNLWSYYIDFVCFFRYFEKKQPGHSERRIKRPGKFPCKVIYIYIEKNCLGA
jgi:hypothetical protein